MIGAAIIGTGSIASTHVRAFGSFGDRVQVRALCELYPGKGEKFAAAEGLSVPVFRDFRDAFSHPGIDLVSICLPPSLHAEAAVAALEAGKHVLVEKPMASSLEECDAMIRAAEKSGKLLSVVAQNRFKVPTARLKTILESGKAGRILYSVAHSFWWRGESYYDLWWRGTWNSEGGGCTLNHAVHQIDLLRWLAGMPMEVTSVITNVNHANSEVEDLSVSIFRYRDGTLAQLSTSLVAHGEDQDLDLQTEKARFSIPWNVRASKPMENGFPLPDPEAVKEFQELYNSIPAISREGHEGQILNFLNAVEGKEPLLVDGRDGRQTLELITGIYKSALTRAPVGFPIEPGDAMYRKDSMIARMPRFHEKTRSVENFSETKITLENDVGR